MSRTSSARTPSRNFGRSRTAPVALAAAVTIAAGSFASAATFTYTPPAAGTGGTDNWTTSPNWSPTTPVSANDTQLIFGGALNAAAAVVTNNNIAGNFQLNNLTVNASGPATGTGPTYTISGNPLQFVNSPATVAPTLTLNTTGTIKPTLTISNNLSLSNDLTIDATTSGTLSGVITGASNLIKNGAGTVTLSNTTGQTFGGVGKTITVNGGFIRTNSNSSFSGLGSGSNKLVLNGGGYEFAPQNSVGISFDRAIEFQNGGTNTIRDTAGDNTGRNFFLGGPLTGNGGFTDAGNSTNLQFNIGNNVGTTLTGTVVSAVSSTPISVNANATRDGLGGADIRLGGGSFAFGGASATPVQIADFTRNITVSNTGDLSVSNNYTFVHTGTLTGSAALSLNNKTNASAAAGSVGTVNGPGANSVITLAGNNAGFSGTVNLTRGTLRVGPNGIGTGSLTLANSTSITSNSTATRSLTNQLSNFAVGGTNTFGSADSAFNGDLNFDKTGAVNAGNSPKTFAVLNRTSFDNSFTGSGTIIKTGAGTLEFTAAQPNLTAGVTISAGTLVVNNTTGSGVGTGNVSIDGGTLGGSGFAGIAGDASNVSFTANGGTIAPGNSPGILTVFGGVDFTSAGTANFAVELNGTTVGSQYDQLVVNTATGGGLINLANAQLLVSLGFTPAINNVFTIIDNNTASVASGTFAGLADNSEFEVNTTRFRIDYDGGVAGGGKDVVLTVVAVPEPATLGMLGLAGVMLLRRRRVG